MSRIPESEVMEMKKILAMLLALVLAFSMVACGGGTTTTPPDVLGGDTTTGDTTTGDATSGDTTIPETPEEILEPWAGDHETATRDDLRKYGFGSTGWDGSLPLTTEDVTLTIALKPDYRATDYNNNPLTTWLEEQTGINIQVHEFVGSASDIVTQVNLMMTGGEELPDIVRITNMSESMKAEHVREGNIVNLAGYLMTDAYYFTESMRRSYTDEKDYKRMTEFFLGRSSDSVSGYVYNFPQLYDQITLAVENQVVVNVDWLNKLGLQKPTTVDELYNVLVAFRDKDPNGNGKKDEIPMCGMDSGIYRNIVNWVINAFIQYGYTNGGIQVQDGKIFTAATHDVYREALKYVNKLISEDLLSGMTLTMGATDIKNLLNPTGGAPATVGITAVQNSNDWIVGNDTIFSYEAMPALKDAGYGMGGYGMVDIDTQYNYVMITSSCENPQLAFRLLDFMCSAEAFLRQRWGEKGVQWDYIENTQYAGKGAGKGHLGGDASIVLLGDPNTKNCRWYHQMTFNAQDYWQYYLDPEEAKTDHYLYSRLIMKQNVDYELAAGMPAERFEFWTFTDEEWEVYSETDTDIWNYIIRARAEFLAGVQRDPNSDADWAQYLEDLEDLNIEGAWIETAQASFERQKAAGLY